MAFSQLYRELIDKRGLTYPQHLVMTFLWTEDVRSVGDLLAALSLKSNTLSPLLKKLEAEGGGLIRSGPEADGWRVSQRVIGRHRCCG